MVRANDSLVDADGLVDDRALVVVMVVRVMRRAVNDSLGHADVLTVAWLVSSTVFTLDLVNGAEIFFRKRLVVVVRLVTVVTVGVDLNMSVRVGGASRSVGERKKQSGSAVKSHLGLMHMYAIESKNPPGIPISSRQFGCPSPSDRGFTMSFFSSCLSSLFLPLLTHHLLGAGALKKQREDLN